MKKTIIVLLFGIAVASAYQSGWYGISSQNEEKVSVYVTQSDSNSVIVHFFIPGFFIYDRTEGDSTYWRIDASGIYGKTDSTELPELPIVSEMIAIPECDSYKEVQDV